jgi:hypothetical protein
VDPPLHQTLWETHGKEGLYGRAATHRRSAVARGGRWSPGVLQPEQGTREVSGRLKPKQRGGGARAWLSPGKEDGGGETYTPGWWWRLSLALNPGHKAAPRSSAVEARRTWSESQRRHDLPANQAAAALLPSSVGGNGREPENGAVRGGFIVERVVGSCALHADLQRLPARLPAARGRQRAWSRDKARPGGPGAVL